MITSLISVSVMLLLLSAMNQKLVSQFCKNLPRGQKLRLKRSTDITMIS